jgi:hypothetical protein
MATREDLDSLASSSSGTSTNESNRPRCHRGSSESKTGKQWLRLQQKRTGDCLLRRYQHSTLMTQAGCSISSQDWFDSSSEWRQRAHFLQRYHWKERILASSRGANSVMRGEAKCSGAPLADGERAGYRVTRELDYESLHCCLRLCRVE